MPPTSRSRREWGPSGLAVRAGKVGVRRRSGFRWVGRGAGGRESRGRALRVAKTLNLALLFVATAPECRDVGVNRPELVHRRRFSPMARANCTTTSETTSMASDAAVTRPASRTARGASLRGSDRR